MFIIGTGITRGERTAEVAIERLARGHRSGTRAREPRHASIALAPRLDLFGRAIELDHRAVDRQLVGDCLAESAGAMVSSTFCTALRTPLPP